MPSQLSYWFAGTIALSLLLVLPTSAQVTPDGTLGTQVDRSGNTFNIRGGSRAGSNLFHSFREFSVPTGDITHFQNDLDISNIFSRVTGLSRSQIDGMIRANGSANLFLLNPNGIVFGPNASLNIGGSFTASTARGVRFADGFTFNTDPTTPALLSVAVPVGLGLGSQSLGTIRSEAPLSVPQDLTLNAGSLEIEALLRAGRNIRLEAQSIQSSAGLESQGDVTVESVGDINIRGIRTQGGDIQLTSDAGSITTNGAALDTTNGARDGGDIRLRAEQDIRTGDLNTFSKADTSERLTSPVSGRVETADAVARNGGDVTLSANRGSITTGKIDTSSSADSSVTIDFVISGNTRVSSSTTGNAIAGNGGAVSLSAADRIHVGNISSNSNSNSNSISYSISGNTGDAIAGNGGTVSLSAADRIHVGNISSNSDSDSSASFSSGNTGDAIAGNGGTVSLSAADRIHVRNINSFSSSNSYFSSGNTGDAIAGNGGTVSLSATDRIHVRNINSFSSSYSTYGGDTGDAIAGNGGTVSLSATDRIHVRNINSYSDSDSNSNSKYSSSSGNTGDAIAGNGGTVSLSAADRINNVGDIYSYSSSDSSFSSGNIGDAIAGNGGTVSLSAADRINNVGKIYSYSYSNASSRSNQATAGDEITGDGGAIQLRGGRITLASLNSTARQRSGNITINSDADVSTQPNSVITTDAFGSGRGGDIVIHADAIHLNSAQLSASTHGRGRAGNITLHAPNGIEVSGTLDGSSVITSLPGQSSAAQFYSGGYIESGDTSISNINLDASLPSGIFSQTTRDSAGRAGNITINTGQLNVQDQGAIATTTFGRGDAGNITVHANRGITLDQGSILSGIAAQSRSPGDSGTIRLITPSLTLSNDSLIQTRALQEGNAGDIRINTDEFYVFDNSDILAAANTGNGGNIDIQGLSESNISIFIAEGYDSNNSSNSDVSTTDIDSLRNNDRADISATSQSSVSGIININTNLNLLNNALAPIAVSFTTPEQAIAGSCLARRNTESNRFVVTGTGGLPASPYDPLNSAYNLAGLLSLERNAAAVPASATSTTWKMGDSIEEAQGLYATADGHILLGKPKSAPTLPRIADLTCGES